MSEIPSNTPVDSFDLLPYHRAIVEYLKRVDPDIWNWFSKSITDHKSIEEIRFELLKSTYRIDQGSQAALYEAANIVKKTLGIEAPLTIYQAQNPIGLNASLAYVPRELHLILHGPLTEKLTSIEIQALLAHEIAHYVLWQRQNGDILTAAEMLRALSHDAQAHSAHFASQRLHWLYCEIFCDRASYFVTKDLQAVVSMLVKVHTGVQEVNPDSYLRQADEIFAHGPASTKEFTHPEVFIRARAMRLWAENPLEADKEIKQMIEGEPGIDELDLLAQGHVESATRRLLDALLCHKWFQSDPVLAHARLYFDGYVPPADPFNDVELPRYLRIEPKSMLDYWCFVLLDFATADRDLDEAPLAKAMLLADQLRIKPRFADLARQELRLRKNQIEKIDQQKEKILADADRSVTSDA